MENDIVVDVTGLSKKYSKNLRMSLKYGVMDIISEIFGGSGDIDRLRPSEFWALKDVNFKVRKGECLAIAGRNGAGKSTLLKIICGIIRPTSGQTIARGRIGSMIELQAGFNPVLTGRENLFVNGQIIGMSVKEIKSKQDNIIAFAELEDFIDSPVRNYSSGMTARLGFSIATHFEPDLLILDEVLAVGDTQFRKKSFAKIEELKSKCAVVFVSHVKSHVRNIADKILFLENSKSQLFDGLEELDLIFGEEETLI
jgi:lipopolysaccharide transport system ATP-binding protein